MKALSVHCVIRIVCAERVEARAIRVNFNFIGLEFIEWREREIIPLCYALYSTTNLRRVSLSRLKDSETVSLSSEREACIL